MPEDIPQVRMIHRLSDHQNARLRSAIDRVLSDVPREITAIQSKLEKATRRIGKVEESLKKIPDDDQLQPMLDKLNRMHKDLTEAAALVEKNEAAVKQIDFQIAEIDRSEHKLQAKVGDTKKGLDRREMVRRVHKVLDDYSRELSAKKARELGDAVAGRFAQLWRKGDFVRRIEIDPVSFRVTLRDRHDREVPKHELSAGEKQIYAISVLWGLASVSGRPLPMVIDTPLGRLDADHRSHIVERYLPNASHQVIILSTDTEIDKTYFKALSASVSHSYRLQYDPQGARSSIEKGYFWKRDKELAHAD
jgi:DNA sulfur modification protein DndD